MDSLIELYLRVIILIEHGNNKESRDRRHAVMIILLETGDNKDTQKGSNMQSVIIAILYFILQKDFKKVIYKKNKK